MNPSDVYRSNSSPAEEKEKHTSSSVDNPPQNPYGNDPYDLDDQSLSFAFQRLNFSSSSFVNPEPVRGLQSGYNGRASYGPSSFDVGGSSNGVQGGFAAYPLPDFLGNKEQNNTGGLMNEFGYGSFFDQYYTNPLNPPPAYYQESIPNSSREALYTYGVELPVFNSRIPRSYNGPLRNGGGLNNRRPVYQPQPSLPQRFIPNPMDLISLEEMQGNILYWAKDSIGCRALQTIIAERSTYKINLIFDELIDHISDLMLDPFGNYVVQKLVEHCTDGKRIQILSSITQYDFQLVGICLDQHGTRAVQKLLNCINSSEEIVIIMKALSPGAVALTKNSNAHHVLQFCLEHFSIDHTKYLLLEVAKNFYAIATDQSGCCVLQQCLLYSRGALQDLLFNEIINNALIFSEDCYANYVIQYVLGLKKASVTKRLLEQLQGHFVSLSRDKYGSHVVEKCLTDSGDVHASNITMELVRSPEIFSLLLDPYANFVIQQAIKVAKGLALDMLFKHIKRNSPMMRSNKYGMKVLATFERKKALELRF